MTPIKEIENDLDWREAEMAVFRVLLADSDLSDKTKKVLFRAAWALLYAHYEGFCKFALTVYYDRVKASGKACKDLAISTQAFALTNQIKAIRNLPPKDLLVQITNFEDEILSNSIEFPDVDTESNLWPNVLKNLLENADISIDTLTQNHRTLSTLVSRRNKISHGENDIIPEFSYYISFENAVKTLMYELALAIDEKL